MVGQITRHPGNMPIAGGDAGAIDTVLRLSLAPYKTLRMFTETTLVEQIIPASDHYEIRLPDDLDSLKAIDAAIPSVADLEAASKQVEVAQAAKASYEEIVHIVAAFMDAKPAVSESRKATLTEGLACFLEYEADTRRGLSPYVLGPAIYNTRTKFAPDISEIMERVPEVEARFRQGLYRLRRLIEAKRLIGLHIRDAPRRREFEHLRASGQIDEDEVFF